THTHTHTQTHTHTSAHISTHTHTHIKPGNLSSNLKQRRGGLLQISPDRTHWPEDTGAGPEVRALERGRGLRTQGQGLTT
ncbi:hypothetical protein ANANG_G00309460, partial [Anguilla anguilla]